jgi:hypothetical protein
LWYNANTFEYPQEDPKEREARALKHQTWLKEQQANIRNSVIRQTRIQLVPPSLAKGFNCFSSVETRARNSFMTL